MSKALVFRIFILALLSQAALSPLAVGDAEPSNLRVQITSCVQALVVNPLTANFSGKSISMRFADTPNAVSVPLGAKLGSGFGASAYIAQSDYFNRFEKSASGVVAKLAHTPFWRLQPKAFVKLNAVIVEEYNQFQVLLKALPSLREDSEFPKDFGWEKDPGYFPFADILAKGSFDDGNIVLFKQRIRGSSVKEVRAKYGDNLPPEMIEGLRKIYDLSQALYRKVNWDGNPFRLDIYPSNFIWVEKPQDLKIMGLTRPSFLMVEASNHPKPVFQENYSFDQFVADYKTFIRVNG